MSDEAVELPSIEDLFPHAITVKHKGCANKVGLAVVKALEDKTIMNNAHFVLELQSDPDRVTLRFRKKRHAKWLKEHKKEIRNAALSC